ncbi:MFS transporter [Staphylococcus pseudoxylosus]|nr:MFS transporter [Staphylococcus pseudoxylosus]
MGQYLLKFYGYRYFRFYGGLVFLVSKIFDAFVDTGVGTYVDSRTNIGKRGKFRPFIYMVQYHLQFVRFIIYCAKFRSNW